MFTLVSLLSVLLLINDILMETVAHQIKKHPRQSKYRMILGMQLSPSLLKEPTGESCCQMAAVPGEYSKFAKLEQEGHATP